MLRSGSFGRIQGSGLCFFLAHAQQPQDARDGKGTPKNFCDKDFAELSGELSGAICLKTLVLMGNSVDVSDIFYFFCSGEGKGESEAPGRGFSFIGNPREGVSRARGDGG